jgi:hypothetical protein
VVLRCRQRGCRFGRPGCSPPLNPGPNRHDTLRVRYTHSLGWLCRRGVVPRSASIASTVQHGWGLNRACSHHTPVSVGTDQGICGHPARASSIAGVREGPVWKLDGLSEYDILRPLVPTGTDLLGLIKHAAIWELVYLPASASFPNGGSAPGQVDRYKSAKAIK